jgi:TetR/AcrR family transcriptional regulator of autoinduction and epiphytic fitness
MAVQQPDLTRDDTELQAEMHPTLVMDGRVLRGRRNREAVVEALLELWEAGDPQPPARAIAERAGVSLRTVFQHFNDMDTLCAAVAQRQVERVWLQLEPLPGAGEPLDVRVDALVCQRAQLFEAITPTRRAALVAVASSPAWLRGLARSEAFLRRQVTETFAAELMDDAERLAAVDFAASWEAWDALRRPSRRSVDNASGILRSMLHSLLTAD